MQERRKFSRIIYYRPLVLKQGAAHWHSKLIDLSLKGALILKPLNWQPSANDNYHLSFELHDAHIVIDIDVKLINATAKELHCLITHIDLDSACHLKRLIELNLGNDRLLHRELIELSNAQP